MAASCVATVSTFVLDRPFDILSVGLVGIVKAGFFCDTIGSSSSEQRSMYVTAAFLCAGCGTGVVDAGSDCAGFKICAVSRVVGLGPGNRAGGAVKCLFA
jgi:hypothetical protein